MVLLLLMTLLMGKDYARAGHGAKGGAHSHHQRAVQNFLRCGRFNTLLRAGWGEGDYWRAGRVGRFGVGRRHRGQPLYSKGVLEREAKVCQLEYMESRAAPLPPSHFQPAKYVRSV